MRLVLVGLSHRTAPVEVRELVAVPPQATRGLARTLAGDDAEAVVLSTCNRTELYLAHPEPEVAIERAEAAFAGLSAFADLPAYRLRDAAAALHLFRVAGGLDSMVPGEGEILGQVRAAYEVGATGPLLDRLFRQALHAGKKIRTETAIGESPASVSSAAAVLAEQVFDDLDGRRILVIGAGKMSELTARSLASRGAEISFVANRTLDRAEELARAFGGEPLPLERVPEELERADVVVSSTSAPGYVLDRAAVERSLRARRGRPLFLIDLAVPRDLDPAIHELDGCYLYDIDDLEAVVAETVAGRAPRGGARRGDRRRGGRALPRLARLARGRARDRVAQGAGRGDPGARARAGRGAAREALGRRAHRRRGGHGRHRQQAPAPADRAHEGGRRGSRRGGLC